MQEFPNICSVCNNYPWYDCLQSLSPDNPRHDVAANASSFREHLAVATFLNQTRRALLPRGASTR